jgi:hypothetical protein
VYVVLRGSGRMKLDDEIIELTEWRLGAPMTIVSSPETASRANATDWTD